MKKTINIIFNIVIVILIGLILLTIFNIPILGYRIFKVGSGSMTPTLNINDLIIIKESNNYNLKDIVTYKENNYYVTHRIVKINGNKVITKGDFNNTVDEEINKDLIVGKVVFHNKYFNTNIVQIMLISFICIYIVYILLRFLIRRDNE